MFQVSSELHFLAHQYIVFSQTAPHKITDNYLFVVLFLKGSKEVWHILLDRGVA